MVVEWIAGATAVTLTILIMQMTKTLHPPAGAIALIPIVLQPVADIGWMYIGIVMLSTALTLGVVMLISNIERRYPV
jgi:CBS-domain-containing membrane protein